MSADPIMVFKRRPHINWGPLPSPRRRYNSCGLCRCQGFGLFDVPNPVWLHYVGEEQRHQIICIGCWRWLTDIIDGSAYEREHGGPLPLWSAAWRVRRGIVPDELCPMSDERLRCLTIATADART